jgi:hypothetical protein
MAAAAILGGGCASQERGGRPPAAAGRYEGTCELAGIDEVPAPVEQREDSVVLVAQYRPSAGAGQRRWGLRFLVQRAREQDLRLHIQAHPTVLCDVDHSKGAAPARIELPPFQGQHGTIDR